MSMRTDNIVNKIDLLNSRKMKKIYQQALI